MAMMAKQRLCCAQQELALQRHCVAWPCVAWHGMEGEGTAQPRAGGTAQLRKSKEKHRIAQEKHSLPRI